LFVAKHTSDALPHCASVGTGVGCEVVGGGVGTVHAVHGVFEQRQSQSAAV